MEYKYEIAISFAGENRDVAKKLAGKLKAEGVEVFYDEFKKEEMWGKDLYEYLSQVYSQDARYCLMIISKYYAQKAWTNHERKNAQERAFRENEEYVLPVRLDSTKIPGIRDTVGYLDFKRKGIGGIVNATLKKLGQKPLVKKENDDSVIETVTQQPRMPKVKKQYSDRDKEEFLYESFEFIKKYTQKGLGALEKSHSDIETSFREINTVKIFGKIYKNGNEVQSFKIWIGSQLSTESICFTEGRVSIGSDNSFHGLISVREKENELQLISTFGIIGTGMDTEIGTKEKAADYLWDQIIKPLEN